MPYAVPQAAILLLALVSTSHLSPPLRLLVPAPPPRHTQLAAVGVRKRAEPGVQVRPLCVTYYTLLPRLVSPSLVRQLPLHSTALSCTTLTCPATLDCDCCTTPSDQPLAVAKRNSESKRVTQTALQPSLPTGTTDLVFTA